MEEYYKKDEKDVILFQLENIGRVIGNMDNSNREVDTFQAYLDRVLLSLYWLEALSSPFLDAKYRSKLEIIEKDMLKTNSMKAKIQMIRDYSKLLIRQINQKNLYFAKYKGFLLSGGREVRLTKEPDTTVEAIT